jgi:hypothetical protein
MNEFEISKAFRENEIKREQYKLFFNPAIENQNSQWDELLKLKNIFSEQLISLEDKDYSLNAFASIKKQFREYLNCFEKFELNSFIDRKTSMNIDDFLFIMITEDIYYLITDKNNTWIHQPNNLINTLHPENGIKNLDLINFIKNQLLILESFKTINYIILYDYYTQFKTRLKNAFSCKNQN